MIGRTNAQMQPVREYDGMVCCSTITTSGETRDMVFEGTFPYLTRICLEGNRFTKIHLKGLTSSLTYMLNFMRYSSTPTVILEGDLSGVGVWNRAFEIGNQATLRNVTLPEKTVKADIAFNWGCNYLTSASVQSILDSLYDYRDDGPVEILVRTLTLYSGLKAALTDAQIAEANARGWIIA